MSEYISEHASALADVKAAGAPVVFRKVVPAHYNPDTDTDVEESVVTVAGYAIRRLAKRQEDIIKYQRLGLIQSEAPQLFFVPTVYGDFPPLESTVTWMGVVYTVRDCDLLAPDGTAIASYVVISR